MKTFIPSLTLSKQLARMFSLLLLLVGIGNTTNLDAQALAIDNNTRSLISIDVTTGMIEETALLSPDPGGFLQGGLCVDNIFYVTDTADDGNLYFIERDATVTDLGPLITQGTQVWAGMDRDPLTGRTFAIGTGNGSTSLYRIDLITGTSTFVSDLPGINLGIWIVIDDLGNAFVADLTTDNIFPIDLFTGAVGTGVPLVDGGGVNIDINFGQDMDFDCNSVTGEVYGYVVTGGANSYGTLDLNTGVFLTTMANTPQITGFTFCFGDCVRSNTPLVPTMGEWGLFLFMMVVMTMSLVFMYNVQTEQNLAIAGSASTKISMGQQLPFDKGTFLSAIQPALILSIVGFSAILVFWGEIVTLDIIGMAIALPIAAYNIHLAKLFPTKK